jgi:hypothetical protein
MEKGSLRSGNTFLFLSLKMAPFRPEIKAHTSLFVPWQRSIQASGPAGIFCHIGEKSTNLFSLSGDQYYYLLVFSASIMTTLGG